MGKRKINRVGTSTLTVSLPSRWAKQYGLKAGEEVEVKEEGPQLVIGTSKAFSTPKKVSIHLKAGEPFRRRYLNVMYRDGYDEIELTSEEPIDRDYLKKAISELLGFELVESSPKRIVVRNVATPNESEFDNIFRRLFLLNVSMARSILDDIKAQQYTHFKEVAELEYTSNKLCYFCQRVLMKHDLKDRAMTLNMYRFASELEQMADHLKRICRTLSEEKTKLSKPVINAYENCLELLEQLYDTFYKMDTQKVTVVAKKQEAAFDEIYSLFHKKELRGPELEIAALMLGWITCIKGISVEMYHL
jgi:phosphate uptake regulator